MDGAVLKRKAAGAAPAVTLATMTPARALRLALAKSGETALGVALAAREVGSDTVVAETAAQGLPDPGLYLQMHGADGQRALAVLCPQAMAAVIEARTMGRVLSAEAAARTATRTDAALATGWIEHILAGAAALSEDAAGGWSDSYAVGAQLPGPTRVALYLADRPHLRWTLALDFAGGAKSGTLWLILPLAAPAPAGGDRGAWAADFQRTVLGTSARLEAVLGRLSLSIERVAALQAGEVLVLGDTTLDDVTLRGPDGRTLARGRLGRSGGRRAVRLSDGVAGGGSGGERGVGTGAPAPLSPPDPAG